MVKIVKSALIIQYMEDIAVNVQTIKQIMIIFFVTAMQLIIKAVQEHALIVPLDVIVVYMIIV